MFMFLASYFFFLSHCRLALTFDVVDNTGCINLTAFNNDVAKLFGKSIDDLYAPTTYVRILNLRFLNAYS